MMGGSSRDGRSRTPQRQPTAAGAAGQARGEAHGMGAWNGRSWG